VDEKKSFRYQKKRNFMAKMKKQSTVPYEFIQEVNKMNRDELVKRFIQEENDLLALKQVKREDAQISELASQIREREEEFKETVATLREKIRAVREEDEELVDLRENKKALEGGYRDEMKRRKAYRDYLYQIMQKAYQA